MLKKFFFLFAGIFILFVLLAAFKIVYPEMLLSSQIREFDLAYHDFFLHSSSQQSEKTGDWPANRRFYYLARVFSRMGIERCEPYLPEKDCQRFEAENILVKKEAVSSEEKNTLLKNIEIKIKKDAPRALWLFYYAPDHLADKKSISSFLEISHYYLQKCSQKKPALWVFLENGEGLNLFLKEQIALSDSEKLNLETEFKSGYRLLIKTDGGWKIENISLAGKSNNKEQINQINSKLKEFEKYFCEI